MFTTFQFQLNFGPKPSYLKADERKLLAIKFHLKAVLKASPIAQIEFN